MSLALIGAAIGSLFSGYISDKIGRKKVILFADIMFVLGSTTMAFAPEIWVLMLGRIIVGIGVGVAAQIVPLYLSEIAPTEIRGKLITFNVAMITIGQLVSVLIVLLLIPQWRFMLGIAAFPAILQFIGMLCLPESPRWLAKMGRNEEAKQVISRLYESEFIASKMDELETEAE